MKKKLLFILFFFGIFFVHGQNEYGLLIKTTLNPRVGGYSTRYTIEGRKDDPARFTTGNIQPTNQTLIQYNFFYITDINQLYYLALQMDSSNTIRCVQEYTVPYNRTTTLDQYFSSCFGYSNVYTVHLTQPVDNNICASENIGLNEGWNYQYKYDAEAWKPLPSQFQEKRSVGIKLKDLGGYEGKSQVFFRAGYQNQFTNTVTYNIIGCSPEYDGIPITADTKCIYESNGSVTLKFTSELNDGDRFLFNIFYDKPQPEFIKSVFATKSQIINNTFIWNNLAKGTYIIKYQAQSITDTNEDVGLSAITTRSFTIKSPAALTFTATEIQPKCNGDKGAVQITASDGTPPYYYLIDNEDIRNKHLFTSPAVIENVSAGNHNIKIIDNNNCREQ